MIKDYHSIFIYSCYLKYSFRNSNMEILLKKKIIANILYEKNKNISVSLYQFQKSIFSNFGNI